MADTADRILTDLRRRRDELRPLVDELQRIEAAIDALERIDAGDGSNAGRSSPARATGRRRGRPRKGQPNRSDQFLDLIRRGGTSIPAAAHELGIGPNYLYRIAATLEREGTIRKQGKDYVMNVDPAPSANAHVLEKPGPEPDESTGGAPGRDEGDDDLVTDEGVNEGTEEIVEE
jgi:hypothetical protein